MTIDVVDPARLERAATPSVTFQADEASATRTPWVTSNGWRFLRQPEGHFYYEAAGSAAPLAAAEAFMYGVNAVIHTDNSGLGKLGQMLLFLQRLGGENLTPLVNIGFIDDGSPQSGEFMNLLVRRNLLFEVVKDSNAHSTSNLDVTVVLGTPDYPRSEASNPSLLAEKVRSHLTDEKRLLRIYGTEVVVGRLLGEVTTARLYLINYEAARGPVEGVRVRVSGVYPRQTVLAPDTATSRLLDVTAAAGATEFTLPEVKIFEVINLSH